MSDAAALAVIVGTASTVLLGLSWLASSVRNLSPV